MMHNFRLVFDLRDEERTLTMNIHIVAPSWKEAFEHAIRQQDEHGYMLQSITKAGNATVIIDKHSE